jgi:Coenzyme PQQ synthesis protein D (PqqD)
MGSQRIEPGTVVRRKVEPVFTKLDDELLALDAQAGQCYSLNDSAARVWDLIETPTQVSEVCERLTAEYDIGRETCVADVIELLGELREAGLIETGADGR